VKAEESDSESQECDDDSNKKFSKKEFEVAVETASKKSAKKAVDKLKE